MGQGRNKGMWRWIDVKKIDVNSVARRLRVHANQTSTLLHTAICACHTVFQSRGGRLRVCPPITRLSFRRLAQPHPLGTHLRAGDDHQSCQAAARALQLPAAPPSLPRPPAFPAPRWPPAAATPVMMGRESSRDEYGAGTGCGRLLKNQKARS